MGDTEKSFKWLHLSDLHTGMATQGWLWPSFKQSLFTDLKRLHERAGPWNLVVFSGDFVQSGQPEEFNKLDEILGEIWAVFASLGFVPALFTVPGNHDLSWPSNNLPQTLLLKKWWHEEHVRDQFWSAAIPVYRELIGSAFSNYSEWESRVAKGAIPSLPHTAGLLPGDKSAHYANEGVRVGLAGLNST